MDKEYRKVLAIMNKYHYTPRCYPSLTDSRENKLCLLLNMKIKKSKILPNFIGLKPLTKESIEKMFVFNYFYKLGKNDDDIYLEWKIEHTKAWQRKKPDKSMPKVERKDNLNPVTNTRNYGSGYGGNVIRVPSKKRKNKMKNFKKLFPDYKF